MHWQECNKQKTRQASFFAKGGHGVLPARFCAAGADLRIGRVTRLHFIVTAQKVKSGNALRAKAKTLNRGEGRERPQSSRRIPAASRDRRFSISFVSAGTRVCWCQTRLPPIP